MPNHVLAGEIAERDIVDVLEDGPHAFEARDAARQVELTTIFEPKPRRVRNIFICSGVVFCASSRMMKLSFRVRPRMNASGAISMTPLSTSCVARSMSVMSNRAS